MRKPFGATLSFLTNRNSISDMLVADYNVPVLHNLLMCGCATCTH